MLTNSDRRQLHWERELPRVSLKKAHAARGTCDEAHAAVQVGERRREEVVHGGNVQVREAALLRACTESHAMSRWSCMPERTTRRKSNLLHARASFCMRERASACKSEPEQRCTARHAAPLLHAKPTKEGPPGRSSAAGAACKQDRQGQSHMRVCRLTAGRCTLYWSEEMKTSNSSFSVTTARTPCRVHRAQCAVRRCSNMRS